MQSCCSILFTICGTHFCNISFIFEPQEGVFEVGKIHKYLISQYHVSLLIYEHYTIFIERNGATCPFGKKIFL